MKLGEPLNYIHTVVPGFKGHLSASVDSNFDAMKPENPRWRSNWFLEGAHSDGSFRYNKHERAILEPNKSGQRTLERGYSTE